MGTEPDQLRQDIERRRASMGETADALGYKADLPSRAKDKVAAARDTVTRKTPDRGQAKDQARRAEGVARENPIGLAIGAAAVGFLAGLVLPTTRIEDEKLGPYADTAKEQARAVGAEALDRGKEVAADVADTAKETAASDGKSQAKELATSTKSRAASAKSRVKR